MTTARFSVTIHLKGDDAMATKAQLRAINKYNREQTISIAIRLNKETDADIIEKLQSVSNKAGYIKALIRKDI